jgi:hypothetical protein
MFGHEIVTASHVPLMELDGQVIVFALAVPNGSGDITVRLVEAVTLPMLASIFVWPEVWAIASPPVETVATVNAEELQVTLLVTSCVIPLANVPAAANCWVLPSGIDGVDGVIVIEASWSSTNRAVESVTEPRLAEIVLSPVPVLTARPGVEALIVATVAAKEFQVALEVTSPELPSL